MNVTSPLYKSYHTAIQVVNRKKVEKKYQLRNELVKKDRDEYIKKILARNMSSGLLPVDMVYYKTKMLIKYELNVNI